MKVKKINIFNFNKYTVSLFLLYLFFPVFSYAENSYVGKEVCAECHKKESKSFERSLRTGKPRRLPNSLNFLKPEIIEKRIANYRTPEKQKVTKVVSIDLKKDYSKEPQCLVCHSTGFNKKGGYNLQTKNPQLSGVTCEACHGAGSAYVPYMEKASEQGNEYKHYEGVERGVTNLHDTKEKVCLTCHKKNSICPVIAGIGDKYKFDYKIRSKRVHVVRKSRHSHSGMNMEKHEHSEHEEHEYHNHKHKGEEI